MVGIPLGDGIYIAVYHCFPIPGSDGEEVNVFVLTDSAGHPAPCVGGRTNDNAIVTVCVVDSSGQPMDIIPDGLLPGDDDPDPDPDPGLPIEPIPLPTNLGCWDEWVMPLQNWPSLYATFCSPNAIGANPGVVIGQDNQGREKNCAGARMEGGAAAWVCVLPE